MSKRLSWNLCNENVHTDKKENQIFLIFKEIQNGAVAKSYMTNGLLIYGEIFAHFLIYEEALPHIWLSTCSTLNFLIYEENLIFFLISVRILVWKARRFAYLFWPFSAQFQTFLIPILAHACFSLSHDFLGFASPISALSHAYLFKGTVAWDGFLALSNQSTIDRKNLKFFSICIIINWVRHTLRVFLPFSVFSIYA
jgi:hypothetical protein